MKLTPRILVYNLFQAIVHKTPPQDIKVLLDVVREYLTEEGLLED